jgi:hypothetical protein
VFSIPWHRPTPRRRFVVLRVEELESRTTPSVNPLSASDSFYSYDPFSRTLTVTGTAPQTLFGFSQSATADATGLHTVYSLNMNGNFQQVTNTDVATIIVNGQGAFNTAGIITNDTYVGTDGLRHETAESVSIGNGGGTVQKLDAQGNATPFITLTGFQTIYATAGHADQGFLLCTPGRNNTFVGAGGYAYMLSGANFYYISGALYVYSFALSPGMDFAYQYDGSGPSAFVVNGQANSFMLGTDRGQSFFNEGVGYSIHSDAIAQHAGDTAFFYDGPTDDSFAGFTLQASIVFNFTGEQRSILTASYFSQVFAFSTHGGFDVAAVYDAQVNHQTGFIPRT